RINRGTGYDNHRAVNVGGARKNVGAQAKEAAYHKEKMLLYQELEAHYLYIAKIQEFSLNAAENSGLIIDTKPLQNVQNEDDNNNVFANDREHPDQPESVNDTSG
nr:hypothetical protein [Tanacetum cinerariifolium]